MSYLDEAAQDMAESFKRIFITAFGHGYDFGCESKEGELKRLRADNAKLRELVSGLEHCTQGLACNCCPLYDPSGTNHHGCESLERELGVDTGDAID